MVDTQKTFHMRRKDREITDKQEISRILAEAKVCHLALVDAGEPYVVPVNYGFENGCIYFHSAKQGRKVDILKKNNRVCFNVMTKVEVIDRTNSCKVKYKSVTGTGLAMFLDKPEEKLAGLKAIMRQNLTHEYDFKAEELKTTLVVRIDILDMKGKQAG